MVRKDIEMNVVKLAKTGDEERYAVTDGTHSVTFTISGHAQLVMTHEELKKEYDYQLEKAIKLLGDEWFNK